MSIYQDHASPSIPMTEEQKFFFDLQGWIVLPAVLSDSELNMMKKECYANIDPKDLNQISGGIKDGHSGALQNLLDHPSITGILSEILGDKPYQNETSYGFRCEDSHVIMRPPNWKKTSRGDKGIPHVVRPPQQANAMRYQVDGKKIFSGLTRLVWELEEVKEGQGGTSFLSGSHKAHFNYGGSDIEAESVENSPWLESIYDKMDSYSCPAGSVVIFTESLLHAANDWTNTKNGRCAIFQCYNSIWAQWHRVNITPEQIEAMPPKRRTLFRGVWALGENTAYSRENQAILRSSPH